MFNRQIKLLREVGENVTIREWVRFVRPETISICDHVMIDDFVLLSGGRDVLTKIGNYVHIACFCSVQGGGGLTMKDFSGFAPGCRLHTDTDDYVNGGLINPTIPPQYHNLRVGHITLERFATLGTNTVVMPGITIGEGATTGAFSFVNKDLEPWTVNVGIPAKPIKMRDKAELMRRYEAFMNSSTRKVDRALENNKQRR